MGQIAAVCLAILLITVAPSHAEDRALSDEQWRSDIEQMSAAIKDIHFKPFHNVTEAEFDSAVAALSNRVPALSDNEIIVGMASIVARLQDGHTRIHIPRLYPEFALEAEQGHSGTPPPKIVSLKFSHLPVRSISFTENDSRAKLMASDRLALPGVLAVLGISKADDVLRLTTVKADGSIEFTMLQTVTEPGLDYQSGLPDTLPSWQKHRDRYRWYEIRLDDDTVYVQVNEFEEEPVRPYGEFVAETIRAAREAGVSRYIIDLRHNSGGIGAWVTPFVTGLANSEFNEYGRLFVLIGRTTFSAAQHFLHKFEEFTYAAFVGEPSGAKPSHYGDSNRIVLENSGLTVRVSTIYWHSWLANDFRDAIQPHIPATLTAADYFAGLDPVMSAAVDYVAPPSLAGQIDEQFRRRKNQNALLLFTRFMSDGTLADHEHVSPKLRSMADRLAKDGYVRPGFLVYFLVNRTFPGDSTTEAGLKRLETLME